MKNTIKSFLLNYPIIGIYGLGITGESSYRYLKNLNCDIIAWDDNIENREQFNVNNPSSQLVDINKDEWLKINLLILSPGVPLKFPTPHQVVKIALENNIEIITDIDLLYLTNPNAKYIGITGTNGKSTTAALVHHILKQNDLNYELGGNIGVPVLSTNLSSKGYVLELSSFQIDLLKYIRLDLAILLNITADHLDRHGTMENYIQAKEKIFSYLSLDSTAIVGIDNENSRNVYYNLKNNIDAKLKNFSTLNLQFKDINLDVKINGNMLVDYSTNKSYMLPENIYLVGNHNKENITAAYITCKEIGIAPESFISNLKSFVGLDHRMQFIKTLANISFYNDSKATNAEASIPALKTLENIYWLAGGVSKDGGIENIVPHLKNVKKAFLFGQAKNIFAKTLTKTIVSYTLCEDLEDALVKSIEDARKEKDNINILLSPSCASFDQFKNFEHRGNVFKELINKMTNLDG